MRLSLLILLSTAACTDPSEPWPLGKAGRVQGSAHVTEGLRGDVWVFLYAPGEGPPGAPAVPLFATAVSNLRLSQGDTHFVFGSVAPNPYRLWGFLDVDSSFAPDVDVLAQAGAGDRLATGQELNLQPGQLFTADLTVQADVRDEPPGFRLQGEETDVVLDGSLDNPVTLTLVSDPAGHLDAKRTAFHVGLLDTNSDGTPDDLDGDGVPELSLQVFLRWKPRPGQGGGPGDVIVPIIFNPAPFLATLGGRLDTEVVVTQLQGAVVPQAQRVVVEPGKLPQVTPVGGAPAGDYELIALTASGQFWRLPNDLASENVTQGVHFHFDRASP